jgi:hypothetical protein
VSVCPDECRARSAAQACADGGQPVATCARRLLQRLRFHDLRDLAAAGGQGGGKSRTCLRTGSCHARWRCRLQAPLHAMSLVGAGLCRAHTRSQLHYQSHTRSQFTLPASEPQLGAAQTSRGAPSRRAAMPSCL